VKIRGIYVTVQRMNGFLKIQKLLDLKNCKSLEMGWKGDDSNNL
jgi:hypothetical protein